MGKNETLIDTMRNYMNSLFLKMGNKEVSTEDDMWAKQYEIIMEEKWETQIHQQASSLEVC